jgi:ribosomal protein L7Ae-like RNA K-turn-binding protein
VRLPGDLVATTERLLEQAALDALAIAHKAGKVAIGFAKAEAALARDRVAGLVNAAEAAPDGTRKLAAALHRRENPAEVPAIGTFTSMQLDLALGRSNVIHAALLAGPESDTFLARAARLDRFRAGPVPGTPEIGKSQGRKSAGAGVRDDGMTKHGG